MLGTGPMRSLPPEPVKGDPNTKAWRDRRLHIRKAIHISSPTPKRHANKTRNYLKKKSNTKQKYKLIGGEAMRNATAMSLAGGGRTTLKSLLITYVYRCSPKQAVGEPHLKACETPKTNAALPGRRWSHHT